jgi:type II secretory pathway pseudopilin PulG
LHSEKSERGFTLIELLVYSMLLVLVVGIAGGMLISVVVNSKSADAVSKSTSAAQLTVDSIDSSIRNSSDFQLTVPSGTDQLLIARTASTSGSLTWSCVAWYYSASGTGSIRVWRSSTAILPPTSTGLASWTLLAEGITPLTGTTVFSATPKQVTVSFKARAGNQAPVGITSAAVSRAGASGSLSCF